MKKIKFTTFIFLLIVSFFWMNISPTIKPIDIVEPTYKDCKYVIDIELNNMNNLPLINNHYFHNIYLYVDGYVLLPPYNVQQ
ncbi:hypothetical protein SAMN05660706_1711 [Desulfoscipio geothermicus DSM 3669]|uniref:Uncharacterized protein n=1 Tax=Desulfoscipio geothermicus DSM 3669 TaxID=1121426 RepID=A0A1I6EM77_9FIRM|nr:hypothetical protein SAMN05660706_1711 [Desulfoscipio geothermicus DSM 3669]